MAISHRYNIEIVLLTSMSQKTLDINCTRVLEAHTSSLWPQLGIHSIPGIQNTKLHDKKGVKTNGTNAECLLRDKRMSISEK